MNSAIEIEATLADLELSQERMMFKTRLIYNFMIEAVSGAMKE